MKKLTLSVLIASAISMPAMAGEDEAKIMASFSAIDSDGNGVVSLQEAEKSDVSDMLMKMDENDDDRITKSEYTAFVNEHPHKFSSEVVMSARAEGTNDAVLVKSDNSMMTGDDTTMNGKVSGNYDREHDQKNEEDSEFVAFEKIDKDNDGELTMSEVDRVDVDASFDEMDTDNDNLITRLEYNEYVVDADIE